MSERTVVCRSPEETTTAGRRLSDSLEGGDVVLLVGHLAAGKTTFVRGLVAGLGGDPEQVDSPTFVLVQSYPVTAGRVAVVHHVDLYRLGEKVSDLREIGLEELLNDPAAVVAVEWPKNTLAAWVPPAARVVRVRIEIEPDDTRRIHLEG